MLVTCLSASNTKAKGKDSGSTKVSEIVKDIIHDEYSKDVDINVVPLMDYNVNPCNLCGKCSENMNCVYDNDFNELFKQLSKSDKIFFVVPFYTPVPSKLVIIFEKMNQILYGGWIKDKEKFEFPLSNKEVGIIGHGGMTENEAVLSYYHTHLVNPISRTLQSLSLKPIGLNEKHPKGVVFGLEDDTCLRETESEFFPEIIHNWDHIRNRIKPLVLKVMTYEGDE